MPTTLHAIALVTLVAIVACNKRSDNQMVTAPAGSSAPQATTPPPASSGAPVASDETMMGPGPAEDTSADAGDAQYRACQQDGDCIAVPRVGCCNNGWMAAVSTTQKDAYTKSFVCPTPHPVCPMYIVHDTRTPKCDPATHLCTMVNAHP